MAFLSADVPRWTPTSEGDVERAIADDILEETHFWDAKQQLNTGKPANRAIAADLAAFSVDGGSILVGLHEDKSTRTFSLAPQPLFGLAERVESIAATAVDPPLYIETRPIPSAGDPSVGYLVIEIPPSARAPHQVEGTYYGRGDKTNIRLSDGEVQRLLALRESVGNKARVLLQREISRDPIGAWDRGTSHVYLVAEPLAAPPGHAVAFLRSQGVEDWVRRTTMVEEPASFSPADSDIPPTPRSAGSIERRSGGIANVGRSLSQSGRQMSVEGIYGSSDPEPGLLDIEFLENGGIRVLVGRGSRKAQDDRWYVIDVSIVMYVRRLLEWSRKYGEATRYRGSWLFAVHADKLAGTTSSAFVDKFDYPNPPRYSAPMYEANTPATTQELVSQPWAVAHRLAEGLTWSLGSYERVKNHLEEPS